MFLTKIRIGFYFLFTFIALIISFLPLTLTFYWFVTNEITNLVIYIFSPIILIFLYILTCFIFSMIHPIFVVNIFLPSMKEGIYPHRSDIGKLMALRLIADSITKSLFKMLTWIPFLTSRFMFPKLMRFYGFKCGTGVHISTNTYIDYCLTEIGDRSFVGYGAGIAGHYRQNGKLILKKVIIGSKVTIGTFSRVTPGCEIGDKAILGAMSSLAPNSIMEPGSIYIGTPASKTEKKNSF